MMTESESICDVHMYKSALQNLKIPDLQISKLEDVLYRNSGGKTEDENLFIIKQKFMLIISNIVNQTFDVDNFIMANSTQNLIPPIVFDLEELLCDLPLIDQIIDDLVTLVPKVVPPTTLQHHKREAVRSIFGLYISEQFSKTQGQIQFTDAHVQKIAADIELGCFLYAIIICKEYYAGFDELIWDPENSYNKMTLTKIYQLKCKTVLSSVMNDRNFYNRDLLLNLRNVPQFAQRCAFLSRNALLPRLNKDIVESLKSEISKLDAEDYKQYESDRPCKKCGKYYVKISQLQIRSADEPMTTYYICMYPKCKYHEKDNS